MAFLKLVLTAVLCLAQVWQSQGEAVQVFEDWDSFKEDLSQTDYSIVDFFASW